MRFFLFCLTVFSLNIQGDDKKFTYSYERIFDKALLSPGWSELSLRDQLLYVRKIALKQKTVSEPVSDRYQITAYGGPIDLVHFLMLAAESQKDQINMNERLYKEWVQEGGPQHRYGFNPQYPCEAHPDDLPSNALGALFGQEIKKVAGPLNLKEAFQKFIEPLKPVPDVISKEFSHREVVMGLEKNADRKTEITRYIWFSAEPLNVQAMINSVSRKKLKVNFCKPVKSGKQGLNEAGFRIVLYKNLPIIVKRL